MIYRSNLSVPDLTPNFKHLTQRTMGQSMGHDVLSDWADKADDDPVFGIWKRCGFMTHDEAAILYNVARQVGGNWCDIGCHTGWTSLHIVNGVGRDLDSVSHTCVDYMLGLPDFRQRFEENTMFPGRFQWAEKSEAFFEAFDRTQAGRMNRWNGFCIDGDHDRPQPLRDAQNAARYLEESGVIIFHDFIGRPVQEAVEYLMGIGFKTRVYWTPHMVACCWRGDFFPPTHVRDSAINWDRVRMMMPDFPFERCS